MAKNKKAAKKRISAHFRLAEQLFSDSKEEANNHIRKARRIAMKHKLRLGKLKRKFCSHCYSYLKPGVNARIRTHGKKVVIFCRECKKYTRIPYVPAK